jgi:type IV pilus modification protein PilV
MKPDDAKTNDTAIRMREIKQQGGFTLIEVLIALTIFAVGLLAIAAMQTSAIRMNSTAGNISELSALGMDRLEGLIGLPYDNSQLDTTVSHTDTSPPPGFTVTWTVDAGAVANTKFIKLTVRGKGKRLDLTCIKAQSL